MGDGMAEDELVLKFDPFDCGCEDTAACFRDDIARTLYLLWRRGHIVSQHFPKAVLAIALRIRRNNPTTPQQLRECFRVVPPMDFPGGDVRRFCDEAIPYFMGECSITYRLDEHD